MTWVSLTLWPFISTALFSNARLPIALLVTIIGGYLLLPTGINFDLPVLPPLNKDTIPAFIALIFVLIKSKPQGLHGAQPEWPVLPGIFPRDPVVLGLFLLLLLGNVGTLLTNRDALFFDLRVLPSLRPYDILSVTMATILEVVPFLLARKVLGSTEGQRLTLVAIAIAAVAYSFLALYETRMSPQLNQMVYGFFPHSWGQHLRSWGWRPIVFLKHGLELSIFFAVAVIAAASMVTIEEGKSRTLWIFMTLWLLFVLIMSKSLGALLITLVVLGVMLSTTKRMHILFVFGITVCVLLYPVIRAADILPYDFLLSNVSAERAHSMTVRLDFEQLLLDKANERPLFGWGGWGRSRVYLEDGTDITIADGMWIIWLGLGGWIKYICLFGLLTWGMLCLFWQRGREIDKVSVGLALALIANLIDLIPNSGLSPVTWLLAGALCGRLEYKATTPQPQQTASAGDVQRTGPVYARDLQPQTRERPASIERKTPSYRRDLTKDRS